MTDVDIRDDGVAVTYEGREYLYSLSKLRCETCGSGQVKLTYVEDHEVEGIQTLALGSECKDCGDTSLHVSY